MFWACMALRQSPASDCMKVASRYGMVCLGREGAVSCATVRIVCACGFPIMYRHTYNAAAGEWTPRTHWHALDWSEENTNRSLDGRWIRLKSKRLVRFWKPWSVRSSEPFTTEVKKLIISFFSGWGTSSSVKFLTNPKNLSIPSQLCSERLLLPECGTYPYTRDIVSNGSREYLGRNKS